MSIGEQGYHLEFRSYTRKLSRALRTARGNVHERRGWIVRLVGAHGAEGFGEALTLEGSGDYDFDITHQLLSSLGPIVEDSEVDSLTMPAVAYALSCARCMIRGELPAQDSAPVSALLPEGDEAVNEMVERIAGGYRTFKLKIGVNSCKAEKALIAELVSKLPAGGSLRLDANGGLDSSGAVEWLSFLEQFKEKIALLEQPLLPGREAEMRVLSERTSVPLALDESIRGMRSLVANVNWPGVIALKPTLAGSIEALREWREGYRGSVVISTALETAVGAWGALLLARPEDGAIGFGVGNWLMDNEFSPSISASGYLDAVGLREACGEIWAALA